MVTIDALTFLVVACLAQLFTASVIPLPTALLTEGRPGRGRTVGGILAASSLGWFFGAIGGSLLHVGLAMQGPFLLGALTSLAGGLILLALTHELRTTSERQQPSSILIPLQLKVP